MDTKMKQAQFIIMIVSNSATCKMCAGRPNQNTQEEVDWAVAKGKKMILVDLGHPLGKEAIAKWSQQLGRLAVVAPLKYDMMKQYYANSPPLDVSNVVKALK